MMLSIIIQFQPYWIMNNLSCVLLLGIYIHLKLFDKWNLFLRSTALYHGNDDKYHAHAGSGSYHNDDMVYTVTEYIQYISEPSTVSLPRCIMIVSVLKTSTLSSWPGKSQYTVGLFSALAKEWRWIRGYCKLHPLWHCLFISQSGR